MLLKSPPFLPFCQQIIIWLCCSEWTERTKSRCSAVSTGFQLVVGEPGISRDAALLADIKFVHVWIKENPVIKWKISKALYTVFSLFFPSQPQPSTGGALLALWFPTKIHFAKPVNALIWPHLPKKKNDLVVSKPHEKYSASKVPSLCKWTHPIIYFHWWRIWASKVQQAACWSTPSCDPKLSLDF